MSVITETPKLRQRSHVQPPESSFEYFLKPKTARDAVDITLSVAREVEDTNEFLAEQTSDAYTQALLDNPELGEHPTLRKRLKFIQDTLRYTDSKTAQYLGITASQVRRQDLRARRKDEIGKFETRLKGGVAIASILGEEFRGYAGAMISRRVSLETPNGKLSDISIGIAMRAGFTNVGVALALETVRLNQIAMGQQRGF